MRYLYPQEFNKLSETKKAFLSKIVSEQQKHSHSWDQIFIMNPGAGMLNAHAFKVRFKCGEKAEISITPEMDKEIQKIISGKNKSNYVATQE